MFYLSNGRVLKLLSILFEQFSELKPHMSFNRSSMNVEITKWSKWSFDSNLIDTHSKFLWFYLKNKSGLGPGPEHLNQGSWEPQDSLENYRGSPIFFRLIHVIFHGYKNNNIDIIWNKFISFCKCWLIASFNIVFWLSRGSAEIVECF